MIKTETIPMHMHQAQSSILPDIYGSSSSSSHHISPRQRALYSKHHPHNSFMSNNNNNNAAHIINGHSNHHNSIIHHHVNPGSYVSAEDRAYFEQIQHEELAQKDAKIVECQNAIKQLQNQLNQTQQHARSMENINNDLESRLEHMAKDRIQLNNQFVSDKNTLNAEIGDWKAKHETESLRNKNLVQNVRQLEKELYMMHLRKYDFLAKQQQLLSTTTTTNNNNNTSIKNNNEDAIALLNRQGGLPSPINVEFIGNNNDDTINHTKEKQNDDEETFRILEENAARQIILKRTNSTIEDDKYDPVTDLAYELSRQRGRGKMVKQLSFFFGC